MDRTKKQNMGKVSIGGTFCIFPNPLDALEEIRVFLREDDAPAKMSVELIDMSMEDFDKLPEFEGW